MRNFPLLLNMYSFLQSISSEICCFFDVNVVVESSNPSIFKKRVTQYFLTNN